MLSNQEIAILCDLSLGHQIRDKHRHLLEKLIADGYLKLWASSLREGKIQCEVTDKAYHALAELGVGLHEA